MDDKKRMQIEILEIWFRENFENGNILSKTEYELAFDVVNLLEENPDVFDLTDLNGNAERK